MSTFSSTPTTIRSARVDDVAIVADVLAQAFYDDPVFGWCLPDGARRAAVLPRFFELVTSTLLAYDQVHVTASTSGAALWVPPGQPSVPEADAPAFFDALGDVVGPD